ncbi:hypothetical protein BDW75DRAFT_199616 [Aspergillus navahoensis]
MPASLCTFATLKTLVFAPWTSTTCGCSKAMYPAEFARDRSAQQTACPPLHARTLLTVPNRFPTLIRARKVLHRILVKYLSFANIAPTPRIPAGGYLHPETMARAWSAV